eukprot:scaffold11.g3970.t1
MDASAPLKRRKLGAALPLDTFGARATSTHRQRQQQDREAQNWRNAAQINKLKRLKAKLGLPLKREKARQPVVTAECPPAIRGPGGARHAWAAPAAAARALTPAAIAPLQAHYEQYERALEDDDAGAGAGEQQPRGGEGIVQAAPAGEQQQQQEGRRKEQQEQQERHPGGKHKKRRPTQLQRLAAEQAAEKEAARQAAEEQRRAAEERRQRLEQQRKQRAEKGKPLRKKTQRGQPLLSHRIEGLLAKL